MVSTAKTLFEIRITGENILPSNFRSKDLAEVITAVEEALVALVVNDYADFDKEDVAVGLTDVREGSVVLHFSSPLRGVVLPAYTQTTEAIRSGVYDGLPTQTVSSIKKMTRFSRRRNCALEFKSATSATRETVATITPETQIINQPYLLGATTIYGKVMRVGGKGDPGVMLDTGSEIINCKIDRKLALSLAKEFGHRLYQWVGVYGSAKWNPANYLTEAFTIERIIEYEDGSLADAFAALSVAVGDSFKKIDDVDRYVASLRGDYEGDLD